MRSAVVLGLCLLPLGGGALAQAKPASSTVIVYRCTDAGGKQSLRDTPCPKGQKQQAREMQRPQDAPPRLPAAPAHVPQRLVAIAVHVSDATAAPGFQPSVRAE